MSVMMEEMLTPEEVADALKVSPETVKRLLRDKKMPGYKIQGSWRVRKSELNEYLQAQRNIQDKK